MEEECVVLSFTLGESAGKEKVAVSEDRTHHLIQSSLRTCLVETREARDHSHQTRQMTPSCYVFLLIVQIPNTGGFIHRSMSYHARFQCNKQFKKEKKKCAERGGERRDK